MQRRSQSPSTTQGALVIDFTEIPSANTGDGTQDQWEYFTRSFLSYRGYKIIEEPDRGPDGKRDLIVEGIGELKGRKRKIRYLVSCKHFAHSKTSVKEEDEINFLERVESFKCKGFIAFYSSTISAGLNRRLSDLRHRIDTIVYHPGRIQEELLESERGQELARQYFGPSMFRYMVSHPLYSANAVSELQRLGSQVDPNYFIGIQTLPDGIIVSMTPKAPEIPQAFPFTLVPRFDPERDRSAIEAYERYLATGQPVVLKPEHVSIELHPAIERLFPGIEPHVEGDIELPSTYVPKVWQVDLILEREGIEIARYPRIVMDVVRRGIEEMFLSNRDQGLPLTFEILAQSHNGGTRISPSLTVTYMGYNVGPALSAFRFLEHVRQNDTFRLVHPDTGLGRLSFSMGMEFEGHIVIETLDRLNRIQNAFGVRMDIPDRTLTLEERETIDLVSSLLPEGTIATIPSLTGLLDLTNQADRQWAENETGDKSWAILNLNQTNVYELLGPDLDVGPVLTVAVPVYATDESVKAMRAALKTKKTSVTVSYVPRPNGSIRRYAIRHLSDEDAYKLQELLPDKAWGRVQELRSGH